MQLIGQKSTLYSFSHKLKDILVKKNYWKFYENCENSSWENYGWIFIIFPYMEIWLP